MRVGKVSRETRETKVDVEINLDGSGENQINTGIGFFDHMLNLFAAHGNFDLAVTCAGDLEVDGHHSVEDIGISTRRKLNLRRTPYPCKMFFATIKLNRHLNATLHQ